MVSTGIGLRRVPQEHGRGKQESSSKLACRRACVSQEWKDQYEKHKQSQLCVCVRTYARVRTRTPLCKHVCSYKKSTNKATVARARMNCSGTSTEFTTGQALCGRAEGHHCGVGKEYGLGKGLKFGSSSNVPLTSSVTLGNFQNLLFQVLVSNTSLRDWYEDQGR